jgi:hypothetical protein
MLDIGNNDYSLTTARASSPPYGEDLHNGNGSLYSGRIFSNGLITIEFIGNFNHDSHFY